MNSPNPMQMAPGAPNTQGINPQAPQMPPQAMMQQMQLPPDDEQAEAPPQPQEEKLRSIIENTNLAKELDEDQLKEIGKECHRGFEDDLGSRSEWDRRMDDWIKLAIQTQEMKTYPWPKASNVKYPLISTAAMQFAARAYPALVPANGNIVNATVVGFDKTGEKLEQARRVSSFMSYQLLHEVEDWEESMDKLLIQLPVVGVLFKKTYWCPVKKIIVSEVVHPKNFVVNYWTKNLASSERMSEIIPMSPRLVKERMMSGTFLDIELGSAPLPEQTHRYTTLQAPAADNTTPYSIIEQHTYLDLDDDGYKEPYVVTFHRESGKVLRITARFDENTMYFDDKGKIEKIEAIQYYTKFGFIPNPDGSFYDMGFGTLLGPLNEAVNTLINQLIDAGTLNNMQTGFIGKGLRLKLGEARFTPGEWKSVNATGSDLKQQIMPLPTKEPSAVLMQLMGTLITSGKELASVAEIFTGKMPGQNTPATTTMATVEQGMKVFTAVYKRIYRSLNEEFKKIFCLNGVYLNPQTYVAVLDTTVGPDDFDQENKTYNICPGADPSANSQQEKLQKAQGLMELLPTGILDPVEVIRRLLDAMEQPNPEKLFSQAVQQTGQPPPPPPDPKLQEMQMKGQMEQQKLQMQGAAQQQKAELAQRDQATQLAMKQQQQANDQQNQNSLSTIKQAEAIHNQAVFSAEAQQKLNLQAAQGHQALQQKQEQHQQNMRQQREAANAKPKSKGNPKK